MKNWIILIILVVLGLGAWYLLSVQKDVVEEAPAPPPVAVEEAPAPPPVEPTPGNGWDPSQGGPR